MSENYEKVKEIVIDKVGVDDSKITMEAKFIDDLGADSLDTVVRSTAGPHLKGPAIAPSVMEISGTTVVKSISLVTTPGLIVKGILSLLL